MTDYEQFKKWVAITAIADAWWTSTLGEETYKKWLKKAQREIEGNIEQFLNEMEDNKNL